MREWEASPEILKEPIIDIGAGLAPLTIPNLTVVPWDKEQGDATFMASVPNSTYQTVYSHHCLEHIDNPILALQNWWRILKLTGYLYVTVPHRNYYEKRRMLPSIFNPDHRTMWLPDEFDPPNTFSLLHTIRAACPSGRLHALRTVLTGYEEKPQNIQSPEGFHIEAVMQKV
jgi:SAM-dependent methyltransferase